MGAVLTAWNLLGRTAQAFMPALARPDDDLARGILTKEEFRLYLLMDARDRTHSLKVARTLLQVQGTRDRDLLAAALLHDVAKSLLPFNAWHRVIAHLYRPTGLPAAPLAPGLRGSLQLREHHESIGAHMLRSEGVSGTVVQLLEELADSGPKNERVRLLRQADDAA